MGLLDILIIVAVIARTCAVIPFALAVIFLFMGREQARRKANAVFGSLCVIQLCSIADLHGVFRVYCLLTAVMGAVFIVVSMVGIRKYNRTHAKPSKRPPTWA